MIASTEHGGGNISVWDSVVWSGTRKSAIIDGIHDAGKSIDIPRDPCLKMRQIEYSLKKYCFTTFKCNCKYKKGGDNIFVKDTMIWSGDIKLAIIDGILDVGKSILTPREHRLKVRQIQKSETTFGSNKIITSKILRQ